MSKFKEMKESIKEKGREVGDWIEENLGKACFLGLTTFEVALFTYVKVSNDKRDDELIENDRNYKKECRESYAKFLEGLLEKTFEEKGVSDKMERLGENLNKS